MNAKELILDKINCGTNLAKCYLHLIMMGFNINDIVSFMISPVVNIINDLSNPNMFDEYTFKSSVDNAIDILNGTFKLNRFFYGTEKTPNGKQSLKDSAFARIHKNLEKRLLDLGFTDNKKVKQGKETIIVKVPKVYKNLSKIISDFWQCKISGTITESLSDFAGYLPLTNRANNSLIAFSDFIDDVANRVISSGLDYNTFQEDLREFEKIYRLSEETSALGSTLLGLNLGIPTSKEELLNKIYKILSAMTKREKMFGITKDKISDEKKLLKLIGEIQHNNPLLEDTRYIIDTIRKASDLNIVNNFNFVEWLNDTNDYRKATADYYNLIKGTWNIFDIIDKLPHFNAIFEAFKTIITFDEACLKKSYFLNKMIPNLFKDTDYLKTETIKDLLNYIDDLLILRWLNKNKIEFPIFNGDSTFNFNWGTTKYTGDKPTSLIISDETSRGSFKKLFEERLFPHLKNGYFYKVKDGVQVKETVPADNLFIKNLVFDINKDDLKYLKLNINMQKTNSTVANESKYLDCLSDFIKLKNYYIGNYSLAEWFMIYNIIVNKNAFGKDRLTTLFADFIRMSDKDYVIKSLLTETGDLDYSEINNPQTLEDLIELGYNRDDALYKIAPIIRESEEISNTAEIVKENKDGIIVYKRKTYTGYGSPLTTLLSSTDLITEARENEDDYLIRIQNYNNFNVILTPFANKRLTNLTNLNSKDLDLVMSALQNYLKLGILDVYTENC